MSIRPLPPALAIKAQEELNEEANRLEDSLRCLKLWISQQTHLHVRTDDQWLTAFLRGCKYNLEKVKKKIELYYTLRNTAAEFYTLKYNDPKFVEILELGVDVILPKTKSSDAPRVILIRPGQFDPKKYTPSEVMSVSLVKQQISYLEDDNLVVSGSVNVMDLEGTSLAHFVQLTPMQMKKLVQCIQDAAPMRIKGIHLLNMPTALETIVNLAKVFLTKRTKIELLYVHSKKSETIFDHIPKEILPEEYGGEAGSIQDITDYWKKKVQEYSAWLEEDMKYGLQEPEKRQNTNDVFGVQGSFKKLELD